MTRLIVLLAVLGVAACDKPSRDDCHKALINMQHLMGTENLVQTNSLDADIRACQGGSSIKSVRCAIKATTMDELRKCAFWTLPPPGSGSAGSGSAGSGSAGSAGSAGSGK